jgi:hypothetical protein
MRRRASSLASARIASTWIGKPSDDDRYTQTWFTLGR